MRPPYLAYALGSLGLTLPAQTFGSHLAFSDLDCLGMPAVPFSLARRIFSVGNAVNDPSSATSRTKTPWGRRRPWLLLYLIFSVPAAFREGARLFWYCLGVPLLFKTFHSTVRMPRSWLCRQPEQDTVGLLGCTGGSVAYFVG